MWSIFILFLWGMVGWKRSVQLKSKGFQSLFSISASLLLPFKLDTAGKKTVGWTERVALKHIDYHMQNRWMMGSCYITWELSAVLCDNVEGWDGVGAWRGGSRGRGHMYIYCWLTLLYYGACVLSCFNCVWLFVTLWTIASLYPWDSPD